jgi:hypothetical protein
MRGAHLIAKRRLLLISRGTKKVIIPMAIMTIDHNIILRAPYLLILYQFSSDSNDFRKRMPYQQFIRILFFCKGRDTAMIKIPTRMLERASIVLLSSISAIPSVPHVRCIFNGTALGTPD